jgi:hypothetical protein
VVLKAKIHEFRSKVAHLSPFCEVSLLEYICVNARNGELDAQDFRNDTEIVPKCRIKVKREANPNHQTHQANLLELLAIQQQEHSELDVMSGQTPLAHGLEETTCILSERRRRRRRRIWKEGGREGSST